MRHRPQRQGLYGQQTPTSHARLMAAREALRQAHNLEGFFLSAIEASPRGPQPATSTNPMRDSRGLPSEMPYHLTWPWRLLAAQGSKSGARQA
jgi:hypothetical protein